MKYKKQENTISVTLEEIKELVIEFAKTKNVTLPVESKLEITTSKHVWNFDHENAIIKMSNVESVKL